MALLLCALPVLLALALLAWLVARLVLSGPDLGAFEQPRAHYFDGADDTAAARAVRARVAALRRITAQAPLLRRLAVTRQAWEELFREPAPGTRFIPVSNVAVVGEWVLAPGADGLRRTLYLHGGAYAVGSPRSHRPLTVALSRLTSSAVLALDYRLLPEYSRRAGIEDCRDAWRWLLDHGPQGSASAVRLFLAGDSAGGNLALSLAAWIRDAGLRAPDAVAALSPQTDCTMASPSLRTNLATDPMLGPSFRPLLRLPRSLLLWLLWLQYRINPRDPVVSPVFGDLAGLPPTLLQASASEMLLDDAQRYAARAQAAGSPVTLQIWAHRVHVWQLFQAELPEARRALQEVARFFDASTESREV